MDDKNLIYNQQKTRFIDKVFSGDKALWAVVILLLIYSIFVVYSTTGSDIVAGKEFVRQILLIGIGLICLFLAQTIPSQRYRPFIPLGYVLALGLTVLMIFVHDSDSSSTARSLKIFGVDSQPFELLKIMTILILADQLAKRQKRIETTDIMPSLKIKDWVNDRKTQTDIILQHSLKILLPIILACGITLFISNSTAIIIAISCFIMLFIGRVKKSDLCKILILGVVVGGLLVGTLLIVSNIKEKNNSSTSIGRLDTFKGRISMYNPNMLKKSYIIESDGKPYYKRPDNPSYKKGMNEELKGKEYTQTTWAKASIASGGFFGKGPGHSTNRKLSEADKDMAYAYLIEEYGFVFGGIVILMAFLILFYRTIVIFKKCGTAFPGLVVLGLGMLIVLQAIIHMMVSVSLFPITGQQLPIISKGGSSLIFMLTSLGLILGISSQAEQDTLEKPKNETILEK